MASQLNYGTWVTQFSNMIPISSADANFQTMVPDAIDYSEQRIYRELDLLFTQVTDSTTQVSSGVREFTLPISTGAFFITVDQFNILTPSSTPSSAATRVPLLAVSPEVVDATYGGNSVFPGVPKYYARRSDTVTILGPAPDKPYFAEVIGIQRPSPLSSANSSTILTRYVPDLFFAGTMIFASAYMRNFGAQADDPRMSQSWETQFNVLMKSATTEQARAQFQSEGWTSEHPESVATPPRV